MSDEFSHLNEDDRLKAENDFLKMKLMLEHDAQFGGDENSELPADIENEFLNNMLAFEKQFEERKRVKVFDKIGRPQQFKPVSDIPEAEINEKWEELRNYLMNTTLTWVYVAPISQTGNYTGLPSRNYLIMK